MFIPSRNAPAAGRLEVLAPLEPGSASGAVAVESKTRVMKACSERIAMQEVTQAVMQKKNMAIVPSKRRIMLMNMPGRMSENTRAIRPANSHTFSDYS